jgi:hypothetical protein
MNRKTVLTDTSLIPNIFPDSQVSLVEALSKTLSLTNINQYTASHNYKLSTFHSNYTATTECHYYQRDETGYSLPVLTTPSADLNLTVTEL